MKIEYTQTVEDYIYFERKRRAVNRHLRRFGRPKGSKLPAAAILMNWIMYVLIFGGPALSLAASIYLMAAVNLAWVIGLIISGLFLFLLLKFALFPRSTKSVREEFERHPARTLPALAIVDETGFHCVAANWSCDIQWPGVRGAVLLKELIVVMNDEDFAYLIPRRAFASDVDAKAFVAEIDSFSLTAK